MTNRFGDWMQTYRSGQFFPLDPRPSDINIEDIAHSLSMQCRYAGHCLRFYCVAEHSVLVARWLLTNGFLIRTVLKGLLHDATEAYLVDVPRPVKPFLTGYKEAEARLWTAICAWASFDDDAMPDAVHFADNHILVDERLQNMAPAPAPWSIPAEPLGITLEYWPPARAEEEFLALFAELDDLRRAA